MRTFLIAILSFGVIFLSSCEDEFQNNQIENGISEAKTLKSGQSVLNFRAHLSGMNEVPAVETEATGQAVFQLSKDGSKLYYKVIVANIDNVIMSHIHIGPEGTNGPVAVWLYPSGPPPASPGGRVNGILAEGTITDANLVGPLSGKTLDDLMAEFYAGKAYVNVHTTDVTSGKIRGQVFGNSPNGN